MNLLLNQMIKYKMSKNKKMIKKIKMNNKKKILIMMKLYPIYRIFINKDTIGIRKKNGWSDLNLFELNIKFYYYLFINLFDLFFIYLFIFMKKL